MRVVKQNSKKEKKGDKIHASFFLSIVSPVYGLTDTHTTDKTCLDDDDDDDVSSKKSIRY